MLFSRKTKEEKSLAKVEKYIKKDFGKKSLDSLLEKEKVKNAIDDVIKILEVEEDYSCYNPNFMLVVRQKIEMLLNGDVNKYDKYLDGFERYIDRNILFLNQKLRVGRIIWTSTKNDFDNVYKKEVKKENNEGRVKIMESGKMKNIYYDELIEILSKEVSKETSNLILNLIVKNVGLAKDEQLKTIMDLLLKNPGFDKYKAKELLYFHTSKKDEKGYVESNGDDILINRIKSIIIKSKILEQNELVGLLTLPYINLWKDVLKYYQLYHLSVNDFLEKIFDENLKYTDKKIILKFLEDSFIKKVPLTQGIIIKMFSFYKEDEKLKEELKQILLLSNIPRNLKKFILQHY